MCTLSASVSFQLFLANTVTFLSLLCVVFRSFLPWLFHLLSSSLVSSTCILAGSRGLQQITNASDPLEIQADVHWTHIREKEEERVVPTSESSTSRGNCFKAQGTPASYL